LIYVLATNLKQNTSVEEAHTILPILQNNTIFPETTWTSPVLPEHHFVLVTAKIMYYDSDKFTVKTTSIIIK